MSHDDTNRTDRRTFLQAGALGAASALALSGGTSAALAAAVQEAEAKPAAELPRRKLGKTGVEITMLEQGMVRSPSLDNILRLAFANGVRTFDTAKVYGSEPNFKRWMERDPAIRKQIFLVTKDMPKAPKQLLQMLDQRLEACGTDYIDLFFIHGLGDDHSLDDSINMVTSREFQETAEAIKKSGKAKFVGFSSHHKDRAPIIEAAAKAGYIDAIMLQYRPWLDKDSPLNRALDVCFEKQVGLITMKQIAVAAFGDKPAGNILDDVKTKVPMLEERKLSPFQGLLHAIWTDERITASCVSMRNVDQIKENADAARRYEPVKAADIRQLRDAILARGPMLCADCEGRCMTAAGTTAELGNLTRYLAYHEQHGDRAEARRLYAALPPEARDWSTADLDAARAACPGRVDFARLLPEADRLLA